MERTCVCSIVIIGAEAAKTRGLLLLLLVVVVLAEASEATTAKRHDDGRWGWVGARGVMPSGRRS